VTTHIHIVLSLSVRGTSFSSPLHAFTTWYPGAGTNLPLLLNSMYIGAVPCVPCPAVKVKVKLSLRSTKHHAVKKYPVLKHHAMKTWGNEGVPPHSLIRR
jgi:hypothetical protein